MAKYAMIDPGQDPTEETPQTMGGMLGGIGGKTWLYLACGVLFVGTLFLGPLKPKKAEAQPEENQIPVMVTETFFPTETPTGTPTMDLITGTAAATYTPSAPTATIPVAPVEVTRQVYITQIVYRAGAVTTKIVPMERTVIVTTTPQATYTPYPTYTIGPTQTPWVITVEVTPTQTPTATPTQTPTETQEIPPDPPIEIPTETPTPTLESYPYPPP